VNRDPDPDTIRIHGFDDQKLKKKIQLKIFFIFFFYQKMSFPYLVASIKNVQGTGEALSPQKRTSSTSKK
jgi:hypothetical protein